MFFAFHLFFPEQPTKKRKRDDDDDMEKENVYKNMRKRGFSCKENKKGMNWIKERERDE